MEAVPHSGDILGPVQWPPHPTPHPIPGPPISLSSITLNVEAALVGDLNMVGALLCDGGVLSLECPLVYYSADIVADVMTSSVSVWQCICGSEAQRRRGD